MKLSFINQISIWVLIASTLVYVAFCWLISRLSYQKKVRNEIRDNSSQIIDPIELIENNENKVWLLSLREKDSKIALHYWNWEEDLKRYDYTKESFQNKYNVTSKNEVNEINLAIKTYNNYMNKEIDPKLKEEYKRELRSTLGKIKKSPSGHFETVSDIFLAYYDAKSKIEEDGWIEKAFKRDSNLKNIWKGFDKSIEKMEERTDKIASPYLLKNNGLQMPKINFRPLEEELYNKLVRVLSKYAKI